MLAPLFLAYFLLFRRTFASLEERDRERFAKVGALPGWRRVLGLAPLFFVVVVNDPWVRLIAILWFSVQLFLDTREHHRRLAVADLSPAFIRRLTRVSILAGAASLAFLCGVALRGGLVPRPTSAPADPGREISDVRR